MSERAINRQPPPEYPSLPVDEWRRWVLFYQEKRTFVANERRFLAWVLVSLTLVTLGFIVEQIELVLLGPEGPPHLHARASDLATWIPPLFFIMGGASMVLATYEFYAERRRIVSGVLGPPKLLNMLVVAVLLTVVFVSALLLTPML